MQELDDKQAFSERLKRALARSPRRVTTAAELAVQFNLRHPEEPITPQAAQKWLTGKARPAREKIRTLSKWLTVSETWLQYGVETVERPTRTSREGTQTDQNISSMEGELLHFFKILPAHRQRLILELVQGLALDAS